MIHREIAKHHSTVVETAREFLDTNSLEFVDVIRSFDLPGADRVQPEHAYTWYKAVYGNIDNQRPGLKLVDKIFLGQKATSDLGIDLSRQNGFRDMILPFVGIEAVGNPQISVSRSEHSLDVCIEAEKFFYNALKKVTTWRQGGSMQTMISVYHNPQGVPIALRKKFIESSALTLVPIEVEGLVLPPGVIVDIDNRPGEELTGQVTRRGCKIRTYEVGEDCAIEPHRLSAWSYSQPIDRALFGFSSNSSETFDMNRAKICQKLKLEDFRQAADKIMRICGVVS